MRARVGEHVGVTTIEVDVDLLADDLDQLPAVEAAGVPFHWILDPQAPSLTVLELR
jgi:hypothetical protein